jgi:trans-2-enoyl-CoA reductase
MGGIIAGFFAAAVVIGIILGLIGSTRLSIAVAAIATGIGVLFLRASTERHGDGQGSLGQIIFGVLAIWAAVLILVVSLITRALRANRMKPDEAGDDGGDHRP